MPYSEGEAVFFKKLRATLKYGLHWDAVISRWARELANEVGALDVTKKSDIYKYIANFYISTPIFELDTIYKNTSKHTQNTQNTPVKHTKKGGEKDKKKRDTPDGASLLIIA